MRQSTNENRFGQPIFFFNSVFKYLSKPSFEVGNYRIFSIEALYSSTNLVTTDVSKMFSRQIDTFSEDR